MSTLALPDPSTFTTRETCARAFCSLIARTITYSIKNVTDSDCIDALEEIRGKYQLARDTVYTNEQITEKMGHTLAKWAIPIRARDENFFFRTSLDALIRDSLQDGDPAPPAAISEANRARFERAMSREMRATLLDALNVLLILYARYCNAKA